MSPRRPWALRVAPAIALVAVSLARQPLAFAQTSQMVAPANLRLRDEHYTWDGDLLRANFSFSDVLTPAVKQKLSNGPASTIVMRAYLFREGEPQPVKIVLQQCVVTYELWDEVYKVQLTTPTTTTQRAAINIAGVERLCGQAQDLAIAPRASLRAGVPHFLAVYVDVNPVSEEVRAQMRQWMQRPAAAAEVGPGDALFSALAGLLFRDVGGSDQAVQFRTHPFVP
jgi:hypothetical protein